MNEYFGIEQDIKVVAVSHDPFLLRDDRLDLLEVAGQHANVEDLVVDCHQDNLIELN